MNPPVSPWRWARAWVLGGSAVALSAAGHVLGGGHVEPVLFLLLMGAGALTAYAWLRRERGLLTIAGAVVVVQLAAHTVLGAGHAHPGSAAMLAGHVGAGLLLAVFLRHGEARIFAAGRRRYLQWLVALRLALAGRSVIPVPWLAPAGGRVAAVTRWIHRTGQGRAPPAAALC